MPENDTLQYQAARDMALRSRSGVFANPAIFAIIALFTPFTREHPQFISGIGISVVLFATMRGVAGWCFNRIYLYNKRYWYTLNTVGLTGLSLSWGMLSMMSLYYYAWDWTTMASCLSAAAFSAGIVATFSIDYTLTMVYLLVMFTPSLLMTAVMGTRFSLTATFLFSVYLIYLLHTARRLHKEYWEAMRNVHLLKEHARELDMKNTELEALAYSISHDLRTPLRSLDGFSELLAEEAEDKLNATEKDYLARIRKSAQRMGELIDDLLKLSRISRANYEPREVNLSKLVKQTFDELIQENPDRNVEVDIEPDVSVQGDTTMLDIAIHNLVNNAWKYSSTRDLTKIRFASTEIDNKMAYYIKDNGIGFDVRYVNKLFSPFQRLHNKSNYPGTGIGLATVKRIMQRHGGRVWANGMVGKGATFYFTLEGQSGEAAEG